MSVRKRTWTTGAGDAREAWVAAYTDTNGVRRLKTFARKKDADAFAPRDARGEGSKSGSTSLAPTRLRPLSQP
jgi:hypothetical protein